MNKIADSIMYILAGSALAVVLVTILYAKVVLNQKQRTINDLTHVIQNMQVKYEDMMPAPMGKK